MAGFDGTGPVGRGSMTGGGRGYCAIPAGEYRGGQGRGMGLGRGVGRGQRNRYYATGLTGWQRTSFTPVDEKAVLMEQAEALKQELTNIQNRISTLERSQDKN